MAGSALPVFACPEPLAVDADTVGGVGRRTAVSVPCALACVALTSNAPISIRRVFIAPADCGSAIDRAHSFHWYAGGQRAASRASRQRRDHRRANTRMRLCWAAPDQIGDFIPEATPGSWCPPTHHTAVAAPLGAGRAHSR